ncbi:MAG: hypothetical protein DWH91_19605 [Planctomycetota bacterium]|nr:MAG: hypothetical protein DWH91_19605 [Planctomycetota bacterium]
MLRTTLAVLLLLSGSWGLAADAPLEILEAQYGYLPKDEAKAAQAKTVDVTAKVKSQLKDGHLRLEVTNARFGDPLPNYGKTLRVSYKLGETERLILVPEGETLLLPVPVLKGPLKVRKAAYGDHDSGSVYDVTDDVKALVNGRTLKVEVTNDRFGDPASGVFKALRVEYSIGEIELAKTTYEGGTLVIEVPEEPSTTTPAK